MLRNNQTGPALAGVDPNARPRQGALLSSGVITIVLSQPCYDLFEEDILAK